MTKTPATAGASPYVTPAGSQRSTDPVRWSQPVNVGGGKVAAAFRGFFLLVGVSAIAVVVFLIVSSAI